MMGAPVSTKIDSRYSDPKAVATSWEDTRRVLETAELFWISTVRADGRPHVTPLVAVWLDGVLYFHTGAQEQKFLNLRANPNVVLTTGCNGWESGLDVVLEGEATQVTDEDLLRRLARAWAAKWDGMWQLGVRDGGFVNAGPDGGRSLAFAVPPTKVFAHSKGNPFGATTHKF
jgi:general stress protein 26